MIPFPFKLSRQGVTEEEIGTNPLIFIIIFSTKKSGILAFQTYFTTHTGLTAPETRFYVDLSVVNVSESGFVLHAEITLK